MNNGASAYLGESVLRAPVSRLNGNIGSVRGYLAAIGGANKSIASKVSVSDLNYLLFANPRLRRYFSSEETPKKKSKKILLFLGLMYMICLECCLSFGLMLLLCFCL